MMLGIDFDDESTAIYTSLREEGVLVTRILPNSLRVLPPLNCSKEEIDLFFRTILQVLK